MECRLDGLDERFTALEGVQNRGEVRLDSAEQISAPRVADTHPDDRRTAFEQLADDEVLILGDDDRANTGGVGSNVSVGGRCQTAIGDVLSGVAEHFDLSSEGRPAAAGRRPGSAIMRSAARDGRSAGQRRRGRR
jgi:hypothetical protein